MGHQQLRGRRSLLRTATPSAKQSQQANPPAKASSFPRRFCLSNYPLAAPSQAPTRPLPGPYENPVRFVSLCSSGSIWRPRISRPGRSTGTLAPPPLPPKLTASDRALGSHERPWVLPMHKPNHLGDGVDQRYGCATCHLIMTASTSRQCMSRRRRRIGSVISEASESPGHPGSNALPKTPRLPDPLGVTDSRRAVQLVPRKHPGPSLRKTPRFSASLHHPIPATKESRQRRPSLLPKTGTSVNRFWHWLVDVSVNNVG